MGVCAPWGCVHVWGEYMRGDIQFGVCAHVWGCQRHCDRETRGWLGSSERQVWEAASSSDLSCRVDELGICVPGGVVPSAGVRRAWVPLCETEGRRQVLCGPGGWERGLPAPNVGPWPPEYNLGIERESVPAWVRIAPASDQVAGVVMPAMATPRR